MALDYRGLGVGLYSYLYEMTLPLYLLGLIIMMIIIGYQFRSSKYSSFILKLDGGSLDLSMFSSCLEVPTDCMGISRLDLIWTTPLSSCIYLSALPPRRSGCSAT